MKKKNIFITGSSKGIGFNLDKHLIKRKDVEVIINGRHKKNLIRASKNLKKCKYVLGDVSNVNNLRKINKKIKEIDILICNVGNGKSAKPGKEKFKDWLKSLKENFSTVNTIKSFEKN